MAEEAKTVQGTGVADQVGVALTSLDSMLAEASRAVAVIRSHISQVGALEKKVRDMETAMNRALESLSAPLSGAPQAGAPTALRPVPPSTPEPSTSEPPAAQPKATPTETAPKTGGIGARCLRLNVNSKGGSLDLKAVDGAVSENPDVVDVALLDYDGRQATLKLWISDRADLKGVHESLLASLKRGLGDNATSELLADTEEASAA